jgi:hypothetical protein
VSDADVDMSGRALVTTGHKNALNVAEPLGNLGNANTVQKEKMPEAPSRS